MVDHRPEPALNHTLADIKNNLSALEARIDEAARLSGRTSKGIELVVVSKNRPPEAIRSASVAGARLFGENRVQELLGKQKEVPEVEHWHFIGTLQRNKVKQIVGRVDLIHSVDRLDLARRIDYYAAAVGIIQPVLIQVNVAREPTKHGVNLGDLDLLVKEMSKLKNISLDGLMTIAPLVENSEHVRWIFAKLKGTYDRLALNMDFKWLSMGMTQDFEVAVAEGSNMIRLGRAVFDRVRGG